MKQLQRTKTNERVKLKMFGALDVGRIDRQRANLMRLERRFVRVRRRRRRRAKIQMNGETNIGENRLNRSVQVGETLQQRMTIEVAEQFEPNLPGRSSISLARSLGFFTDASLRCPRSERFRNSIDVQLLLLVVYFSKVCNCNCPSTSHCSLKHQSAMSSQGSLQKERRASFRIDDFEVSTGSTLLN